MKFSFTEQVDMLLIYGEAQQNAKQAKALYAERYPDRTHPSRCMFQRLCQKLRETGSMMRRTSERQKRVRHEDNEIDVLARVNANPQTSSRQIERESGINKRSVLRILAHYKFHPYHINLHQELHGTDFENRVAFCQWMQHQMYINNEFFSLILFTDEASFTNSGLVNLHNMHYWSAENPHWLREVDHQRQWSINVWCGIIGEKIIGPYFINGTLTSIKYDDFIRNDLGMLLEDVELNIRRVMWYQHDGCPAHYGRIVRATLNEIFPQRWIGRGGPISWPARSPDLTPLDFFLWGTLKNIVYQEVPTTPENMKQRIIAACATIGPEVIRSVRASGIQRLQCCIDVNGHHFEHFL